jgi:hypothetical protein
MADDMKKLRAETFSAEYVDGIGWAVSGRGARRYLTNTNDEATARGWARQLNEAYEDGMSAARRQPDAGVVVPDTWLASVQYAYGYLWHVDAGVGAPGDCAPPSVTAAVGAMKARKMLYCLLDHHQRGDAIALVRSELPYATPPASPVPESVRAAILEEAAVLAESMNSHGEFIADAIRALAEVVPEQRGDSTNEQGRADAVDGERYRYIEEHATRRGGGNGFTLTCFIQHDIEDLGCAIDAAIAEAKKGE